MQTVDHGRRDHFKRPNCCTVCRSAGLASHFAVRWCDDSVIIMSLFRRFVSTTTGTGRTSGTDQSYQLPRPRWFAGCRWQSLQIYITNSGAGGWRCMVGLSVCHEIDSQRGAEIRSTEHTVLHSLLALARFKSRRGSHSGNFCHKLLTKRSSGVRTCDCNVNELIMKMIDPLLVTHTHTRWLESWLLPIK